MSTSAIAAHQAQLAENGIDLGASAGEEQDVGYGGRMQEYGKGRIYWHASTGAHALYGRLLQRYLDGGGHDVNPGTGERELGFPTSDVERTDDGLYERVVFEWGTIEDVAGTALVRLFGQLYVKWLAEHGPLGRLGHPLVDVARIEGGRAAWFEGGFLWHPEVSSDVLVGELVPPLLGQPALVDPQFRGPFTWLRLDGATSVLGEKPKLPSSLMAGRLSLVPVGGGSDPNADLVVRDEADPQAAHDGGAGVSPGPPAGVSEEVAGSSESASVKLPAILHLEPEDAFGEQGGERWLSFRLPGGTASGGGGGGGGRFSRLLEVRRGSDVHANVPAGLERRQLYSLAFRSAGLPLRTIAPHCLYARADWSDFAVAHVTDIHVNRRAERYRSALRAAGVDDAAIAEFNNWNDAFRDFVRYANHLHAAGRLEAVVMTGDLVDYVRDPDDHPDGPGNFAFFEALVQGLAPSPDPEGSASEPLRVPVFTTLGNHDYRTNPYPLIFKVRAQEEDLISEIPFVGDGLKKAIDTLRAGISLVPGIGLASNTSLIGFASGFLDAFTQFEGLNLTRAEALRLVGLPLGDAEIYGIPVVSPEVGGLSLKVDPAMRERTHYYFRRINRDPSYTVALGPHRLVMLDTRWDAGLTDSLVENVLAKLGTGPESRRHLVGGDPDSQGIVKSDLDRVQAALAEAGSDGVVLVGMHAPPLNPAANEYPNYFRETAHPTADPIQVTGYLHRVDPGRVANRTISGEAAELTGGGEAHTGASAARPDALETSPGWPRTGTAYFHVGEIEDLLDYGTGVGFQEEFASTIASGGRAGATLVLCGHVHRRIDYRLALDGDSGALQSLTDYYLENPSTYYPMKLAPVDWWNGRYERVLVHVEEGAPAQGDLKRIHDDREGATWSTRDTVTVPPYASPLSSATDPATWWRDHGPMVIQTAALGPCTNTRADAETNANVPGPQFQGFRVIEVQGNVLTRVHYVTVPDLRAGSFPLPWESSEVPTAAQPDGPPPIGETVSG